MVIYEHCVFFVLRLVPYVSQLSVCKLLIFVCILFICFYMYICVFLYLCYLKW